jgi:FtsZ-interacting cell division protein ZipA
MVESLAEMSDLQTILMVIGALIIVAVIVINWWQEKRFHQQAQADFSSAHTDVLLDSSEPDEPKIDFSKHHEDKVDPTMVRFEETELTIDVVEPTFETSPVESPDLNFEDSQHQHLTKAPVVEDEILVFADNSQEEIDLAPEIKPVQHDDIKAIFDEVFSNPGKTIASYQQSKLDQYDGENESVDEASEEVSEADTTFRLPAMLNANIDVSAILHLNAPTPVRAISQTFSGLQTGYDKPLFINVLGTNYEWSSLNDASLDLLVTAVTCSMQLADRAGALSAQDFQHFESAITAINAALNASIEWQNAEDVLGNAKALDAFCIEVDQSIGFHLGQAENGAFTGTKLRGLAEAQGLTLSADGSFKYFGASNEPSERTQPVFIMTNREDHPFNTEMLRSSVVKGVSFQLEIPRVKQCGEEFSHMVQVARRMELGLNAAMVDDNNKLLGDSQIEKIRQHLKVIDATMRNRGIEPGSDSALRLFS